MRILTLLQTFRASILQMTACSPEAGKLWRLDRCQVLIPDVNIITITDNRRSLSQRDMDKQATLKLPAGSTRHHTNAKRHIVQFMNDQIDEWLASARGPGREELREEDIMFVTGVTWASQSIRQLKPTREGDKQIDGPIYHEAELPGECSTGDPVACSHMRPRDSSV